MGNAYNDLNAIWARRSIGGDQETADAVLALLLGEGISRRTDDGELFQVNLSRPTATANEIVVGLRYMKRDGTHTEDHFLVNQQGNLIHYNKQSLAKRLDEYRGTHKQQVNQAKATGPFHTPEVNTISLIYSR